MLSVAFIPDEWKTAVITPVHKKGPTEQVSNYRPISITCVPCTLLQGIIANQIYRHLNENNILCMIGYDMMDYINVRPKADV